MGIHLNTDSPKRQRARNTGRRGARCPPGPERARAAWGREPARVCAARWATRAHDAGRALTGFALEPGARVLDDHFPRAPRVSTARADDGPCRAPAKAAPTRAAGTGVAIEAWTTRADEKRLRPGEEYALYHARDVRGAQPGAFGVALARAAEWAGVGVDAVGALVEVYERRLLGADERARRRSKSAATDRVAGSGDGDGR
jgi:hypothetical protein